jgi:hypothetical protein
MIDILQQKVFVRERWRKREARPPPSSHNTGLSETRWMMPMIMMNDIENVSDVNAG